MDPQKLAELREKRGEAYTEMQRILDACDGTMSAEDTEAYDKAERDFDAADAVVRKAERQASRDRSSAAQFDDTGDAERNAAIEGETRAVRFERALNLAAQSPAACRSFMRTPEYREAFREGVLRGYLGGSAVAPEYRSALNLVNEQRAYMNLGTDADGGYIAPEEFVRELFIEAAEESVVRQFATVLSTSHGRDLVFPQFGNKPTAKWTSAEVLDAPGGANEPDDYVSNPSLAAPKTLKAHPAQAESQASKDLLQDSVFDVEAMIRSLLVEAFSVLTAESYWTGTGTGQPKGLIADIAAGQTKTGATGQTTTVTTDDLIDVQHLIKRRYRADARWFFNDATLKAARKLEYADGRKIWEPALSSGEPARILGKPYEVDEYIPDMAAGATGIVYGSLKGYTIRDVLTLAIERLTDSAYTRRRLVGFLGDIRTDGLLLRPEAIAAYKNAAA